MNNNKNTQITLEGSTPLTCQATVIHRQSGEQRTCGSPFFEKNVILANLSKLHNPTTQQQYVEVEFLRCKYCRTILKETFPTEFEHLIRSKNDKT